MPKSLEQSRHNNFQHMYMNQFFKIRSLLLLAISWMLCAHLSAQVVSFSVAGSNPHCYEQYPLPNGVPYTGSANVFSIPGAYLVNVTFQIERYVNTSGWSGWGNGFTLYPISVTDKYVNYNQNSPGATKLTLVPTNLIRMSATIRYRTSPFGPIHIYVAKSPTLLFDYYNAPSGSYTINGLATSPTLPIILNQCDSWTLNWVSGNGTGPSQWRYQLYPSTASGGVNGAVLDDCGWFQGNPPAAIDMKLVNSECMRELETSAYNGFFLVRVEVTNGCGTVTQDALVLIQPAPSGAQVNFSFFGGLEADAYADYGADETNPNSGQISQIDRCLSQGGTLANPTWVGATQTTINGNSQNFYGGINSYLIVVEDVTNVSAPIELGRFSSTEPPSAPINLGSILMAYPPNPKDIFFFNQHFNEVLGKIFRVTLTGFGCGNQNPSKQGFFKIIPDNPWWTPIGGNESRSEALSQSPDLVEEMRLSPNPARDLVNIEFNSADAAEGSLRIIGTDGKAVSAASETVIFNKGKNVISRDIQQLPTGTYFIQVVKSGSVHTQKFVKLQ